MTPLLPAWLTRSADAFRRLADQPWILFVVILAVNALARPYANCSHDARLYSLQVLNQAEDGAFADDVFLRYGSQDHYSLFSRLVAPLVAIGGVRATFFVLYLIFNTLFVWGLFRLVRALIADPFISTAALIYLVAAELRYGGHWIFTVHEQFFTPRLVATALTLHALAFVLSHRFIWAFALLAVAMMFHPLMALGGVMIWTGYLAKLVLSTRLFYASLAAVSAAALIVLAVPSIGLRIFGEMDSDWHDLVRVTVLYNYPTTWDVNDWANHLVSFALCIAGFVWLFRDDPVRSRFLFIANLAGIIGLTATLIASMSPYALLFQGQPYRAVWILKVLQVPLGFLLLARLVESTALVPRLLSIALVGFFLAVSSCTNEMVVLLFVLPIAVFYWRRIEEPAPSDWWLRAAMSTLVGGAFGWMLYRWGFTIAQREMILTYYDQAELIRIFVQIIPAAFWIAAVLFVLRWFPTESTMRPLGWSCMVLALAMPTFNFAIDTVPEARGRLTRYGDDVAFAREVIGAHGQKRVPAVYSSLGRAEYVWIDLHATSYYDAVQTAGVMFRRDTAVELNRRVEFVRNFEMARLRKEAMFLTPNAKDLIEEKYQAKFDGPAPTEEDLVRLCQQPELDFVVIPQEFPGLYSATNGRIYVYECEKVNRLRLSARSEAPSEGRVAANAKPQAVRNP